jgi:Na+/H+ antiporter NhaC
VITHVTTQLPYMVLAVVASTLGYVVVALSGSTTIGLVVTLVVTGGLALLAIRVWGPSSMTRRCPPSRGREGLSVG